MSGLLYIDTYVREGTWKGSTVTAKHRLASGAGSRRRGRASSYLQTENRQKKREYEGQKKARRLGLALYDRK